MANPLPLISLATADLSLVEGTTFLMTNQDADYPATNLGDGNPAHVAKSTLDVTTITISTDSSAVQAVALINTNAVTATVNGNTVLIPSVDYDLQRIHGWADFRTSELGPGSSWNIALTSAGGAEVWIGHIALLTSLLPLNLKYGLAVGRHRPGDTTHVTRLGSALRSGVKIRTRWARGVVDLEEDEALMRNLEASAEGTIHPLILIPDEVVNDAWLVHYAASDFQLTYQNYSVREVPVSFEEQSSGPPNG